MRPPKFMGAGIVFSARIWYFRFKNWRHKNDCLFLSPVLYLPQHALEILRCVVWHGVAGGCGVAVVWCDVMWCGVVWCDVVWCGVVWCGVVWCGVVWHSVVQCVFIDEKMQIFPHSPPMVVPVSICVKLSWANFIVITRTIRSRERSNRHKITTAWKHKYQEDVTLKALKFSKNKPKPLTDAQG